MGSTWPQHGLNMASTWAQRGLSMASTWAQRGLNMGSTWTQHGPNMGSTWAQCGLNINSTWAQHGCNMGSTCSGHSCFHQLRFCSGSLVGCLLPWTLGCCSMLQVEYWDSSFSSVHQCIPQARPAWQCNWACAHHSKTDPGQYGPGDSGLLTTMGCSPPTPLQSRASRKPWQHRRGWGKGGWGMKQWILSY